MISRKGLGNLDRPIEKRKRCSRGHSYAKHGKKDSAGYLRCGACLRETQATYRASRRSKAVVK